MSKLNQMYRHYPILKKTLPQTDATLERHITFKTLKSGEFLQSTEDTCLQFPFILKGQLQIQKCDSEGRSINLYQLRAGDMCHEGLKCILQMSPNQITATALVDSEVCLISLHLVKKYLLSNSDFLTYIYQDLSDKFSYLMFNKFELVNESLEHRLIKYLTSFNSPIIYTTHEQIATNLDSAREVISKKLKELEQRGYLTLSRGKIKLTDRFKELL